MIDRPYTIRGDSEVERGVQAVVAGAVAAAVAELKPDAVLLTGSFARGEGGAFVRAHEVHLVSDVDLMVVYRGPASLPRAVLASYRVTRIAGSLNRDLPGSRVDVTARPAALLAWPPATLESHELLRSARFLHGSVRLAPPSAVRQDDIPPSEIGRMLFKRGAALLLSWVRLMTADDTWSEATARLVQRDANKAILACGDAWLLHHGAYDHRLLSRLERFRHLPVVRLGPTSQLRTQYEQAAQSTLLPDPESRRSRAEHLGNWRAAARTWLECSEGFQSWRRDPVGQHRPATRDLLQILQRTVPLVRRLALRIPTTQRLAPILPLLLQLALDDRRDDGAVRAVAAMLHEDDPNAAPLLALACRFLSAWRPTASVRAVARRGMGAEFPDGAGTAAARRHQLVVERPAVPSDDTSNRTHIPATACPGITQTIA
jgi:predicted nucleotidyltransferase